MEPSVRSSSVFICDITGAHKVGTHVQFCHLEGTFVKVEAGLTDRANKKSGLLYLATPGRRERILSNNMFGQFITLHMFKHMDCGAPFVFLP